MKMIINLSGIILRLVAAGAALLPVLSAGAAKPEEMDRARAVAACVYMRYCNDDAKYLDGYKPANVAEVRAKVSGHAQDEANLRQFLEQSVANDYESWDQEQLATYWSSTFFDNSQLSDRDAKNRNKKIYARLRTMDVTVVPPTAETAPEQTPEPDQTSYANYQNVTLGDPAAAPAVDTMQAAIDEVETVETQKTAGNNNWIYIVLLVVLIIIVIALVVFAMRSIRNNRAASDTNGMTPMRQQGGGMTVDPDPSPYVRQQAPCHPQAANVGGEDMQMQYARIIQQKNEEITRLRAGLEETAQTEQAARQKADQLASSISAMQMELQQLRDENQTLRRQSMPEPVQPYAAPGVPGAGGRFPDMVEPQRAPGAPRPRRAETDHSREKVIYLGRANRDRVFVRADKELTPGKTVYRLVTTNGLTGSFYVDTDPRVASWVALDPRTSLFGACEVATFANADRFTSIVTDTAGTAIFEDGCWKVLRPCAAHLE